MLNLRVDSSNEFDSLCQRDIKDINSESKNKDRLKFEKSILKSLSLSTELSSEILNGVIELVDERYLLPKMKSTRTKKRVEQDLVKLKEDIIEEILPGKVIKFPDGFIKDWSKTDCKEISVPAGILKLGENFFDRQQICDQEGVHLMDVGSENEGKFIVYAKKKDEFVVKIPNRLTVIGKAVKDYEIYLKELKQKLYRAFMEKCGDHNLSENLTRQVFEDFNLHYL